jgi:hypothetical protein
MQRLKNKLNLMASTPMIYMAVRNKRKKTDLRMGHGHHTLRKHAAI